MAVAERDIRGSLPVSRGEEMLSKRCMQVDLAKAWEGDVKERKRVHGFNRCVHYCKKINNVSF